MLTALVPPPHRCNALAYSLLLEACELAPAPIPPAPIPTKPPLGRPMTRRRLTPVTSALLAPLPPSEPTPTPVFARTRACPWTRDTATAALHAFVVTHGRVPVTTEWRHAPDYDLPDPGFVRTTWGRLGTCYRALGLTPNPPRRGNQWSRTREATREE